MRHHAAPYASFLAIWDTVEISVSAQASSFTIDTLSKHIKVVDAKGYTFHSRDTLMVHVESGTDRDFTIEVIPKSLSILPGSSDTAAVAISYIVGLGFPVGLSARVVPSGLAASFPNLPQFGGAPGLVVTSSLVSQSGWLEVVGNAAGITRSYEVYVGVLPSWPTIESLGEGNAISVFGSSSAVVVGNSGNIWFLSNGTWGYFHISTMTAKLTGVSLSSGGTGAAVGENGTILWTSDGGATWKPQTSPSSGLLSGVFVPRVASSRAIAVGAGGTIIATGDSGKTWQAGVSTGTTDWYGVSGSGSGGSAIVVGGGGQIRTSPDAGQHWYAQTSGTTTNLRAVSGYDSRTAIAVGDNGAILQTIDGGVTWKGRVSGTTSNLNGVRYTDINTIYAVGDNGTILLSDDGGVTWTRMDASTTDTITGISSDGIDFTLALTSTGNVLQRP